MYAYAAYAVIFISSEGHLLREEFLFHTFPSQPLTCGQMVSNRGTKKGTDLRISAEPPRAL